MTNLSQELHERGGARLLIPRRGEERLVNAVGQMPLAVAIDIARSTTAGSGASGASL